MEEKNKNIKSAANDNCRFERLVMPPNNSFINGDCLEYMKTCPNKHFDLAIVDPPYGMDWDNKRKNSVVNGWKKHKHKGWDISPPKEEYFNELFRVSINCIIWGGNFFTKYLPPKQCWLVWYKVPYEFTIGQAELAWSSFDKGIKVFERMVNMDKGFMNKEGQIHPTQKPIQLYRWMLRNYATAGDLILDTHVGSASSLVACVELGFDYIGFEIDKEYYEMAKARLGRATRKYELEF